MNRNQRPLVPFLLILFLFCFFTASTEVGAHGLDLLSRGVDEDLSLKAEPLNSGGPSETAGTVRKMRYSSTISRQPRASRSTVIHPKETLRLIQGSLVDPESYALKLALDPRQARVSSKDNMLLIDGTFEQGPFQPDILEDPLRAIAWNVSFSGRPTRRVRTTAGYRYKRGRARELELSRQGDLRALVDVTRRLRLELASEVSSEIRLNSKRLGGADLQEQKTVAGSVRSGWQAMKAVSVSVDLKVKAGTDALSTDTTQLQSVRQKYEVSWKAHRNLLFKPALERTRQMSSDGKAPLDGGTSTLRGEENRVDTLMAETLLNVSPSVTLRYVNARAGSRAPGLTFFDEDTIASHYAEILYAPSNGTKVRLSYGRDPETSPPSLTTGSSGYATQEKTVQLKALIDL